MYVVYPSIVNYTYLFQRPQQIMRRFGKEGFDAIFYNNGATLDGCTQYKKPELVDENLTVVPQNYGSRKYEGNCVFYNSFPGYATKAIDFKAKVSIFDCIDEPVGIFSHWNIGGSWEYAVESADIVLASAQKLYDNIKAIRKDVVLVPNGCDFEHFRWNRKWNRRPKEYEKLDGPIITFCGAIAPWLDHQLIYDVAKYYPEFNFVMVGALYDMDYSDSPENIHVLGHKPYQDLPPYLHYSDVLTIPFDINNPVIEATNPIKLWEYLATGKPIVTTNIPEVTMDCVYKTRTKNQYMKFIERSMKVHTEEKRGKSVKIARQNSWTERVQRIVKKLEEFGIYA